MANTELIVANLEFATIKNNLRTFMSAQSELLDYNFEGSSISVLLDVLAYNTYYNNIYLNHVATEMFLDSAQLRDSVYSLAKTLNYTPTSFQSAVAFVDIDINPASTPESITIPRLTSFISTVGDNTYTFSTNSNITVHANNGYQVSNVALYEGELVTEAYLVSSNNRTFYINNFDVDVSSLVCTVRNSNTDSTNSTYTRANSLFDVGSSSNVFFVEPASNGSYNVVFGNGTFGRQPNNGNLIEVSYRVASGTDPNGANSFSAASVAGHPAAITLVTRASGGVPFETLDDIKFSAPRTLAVQERAVTKEDYKTLIQNQFTDITSMNVFGGEELDPPQFGTVVMASRSAAFDQIPTSIKTSMVNFIKPKTPIGVTPKVQDPEFINIKIDSKVKFNVNDTSKQRAEITTLVRNTIDTFNTDNLDKFDTTFRKSKLIEKINETDPSILSNELTVRLTKSIAPTINQSFANNMLYNNPIKRDNPIDASTQDNFVSLATPAVESDSFTYNNISGASLRDDGAGKLMVVTANTTDLTVLNPDVGTVFYSNGNINISNLVINAYSSGVTNIDIRVRPEDSDVTAKNVDIIRIKGTDTVVIVTEERE